MHSCVQTSGQAVRNRRKTVASTCTTGALAGGTPAGMRTTSELYAPLYAVHTRNYPRAFSSINREYRAVIPTVHSPNNKNYTGDIRILLAKTVERRFIP